MTVARTCKRGAPALTRKETTYSLKASAEARVHPRVGEILFFLLPAFFLCPSTDRLACSRCCRRARPLRKERENKSRGALQSAIQHRNLFQFHGSPFAMPARPPAPPSVTFHSYLFFIGLHYCVSVNPSTLSLSLSLSLFSFLSSPSPFVLRFPHRKCSRACSLIYLVKLSFYPLRISFKLQVLVAHRYDWYYEFPSVALDDTLKASVVRGEKAAHAILQCGGSLLLHREERQENTSNERVRTDLLPGHLTNASLRMLQGAFSVSSQRNVSRRNPRHRTVTALRRASRRE